MSKFDFDDEDDGLFKRHRWLLPVLVIAIGAGGYFASKSLKLGSA
ncbi:MAG: hypothetical protein JWO89_1307, partial [Verrucomicrobiaceae bacterium]|nr:hypothetical protein [Verrucomicrobiaceae bacterium]